MWRKQHERFRLLVVVCNDVEAVLLVHFEIDHCLNTTAHQTIVPDHVHILKAQMEVGSALITAQAISLQGGPPERRF